MPVTLYWVIMTSVKISVLKTTLQLGGVNELHIFLKFIHLNAPLD